MYYKVIHFEVRIIVKVILILKINDLKPYVVTVCIKHLNVDLILSQKYHF